MCQGTGSIKGGLLHSNTIVHKKGIFKKLSKNTYAYTIHHGHFTIHGGGVWMRISVGNKRKLSEENSQFKSARQTIFSTFSHQTIPAFLDRTTQECIQFNILFNTEKSGNPKLDQPKQVHNLEHHRSWSDGGKKHIHQTVDTHNLISSKTDVIPFTQTGKHSYLKLQSLVD